MKTRPECLPCFLRQASAVARIAHADGTTREKMLRSTLRLLSETSFDVPPPKIAHEMYPMLCRHVGLTDPYGELKTRYNGLAQRIVERLLPRIQSGDDPFRDLLKLALAGNIVDFGISDQFDLDETVSQAFRSEPEVDEIQRLRDAVDRADKILYLTDNTGEIAFDRAWIEYGLPREKITAVVRSAPIINDATRQDAIQVGLDRVVPIIDPNVAVPGMWLQGSSKDFLSLFHQADLVISKGQGNFETLFEETTQPPIFFLFMVKCPVVSSLVNLPQGSRVAAFHDTMLQREKDNESR